MKHNNEKRSSTQMQLNNIYYEYNIESKGPIISRLQLFILTVFSACLTYHLNGDEFYLTNIVTITFSFIGLIIFFYFAKKILWSVKKESLIIIRTLGLQSTITYHFNFKASKFIPWHLIDDVIINEAIFMQRIICYLAVLVKTEDDNNANSNQKTLFPLFLHSQPQLAELKEIYRNIQHILRK